MGVEVKRASHLIMELNGGIEMALQRNYQWSLQLLKRTNRSSHKPLFRSTIDRSFCFPVAAVLVLLFFLPFQSLAALSDGLVAHYTFNNTTRDVSPFGNDGTTYDKYVEGKIGQAAQFDSNSPADYIDVSHDTSLDIAGSGATWSASTWVKFTDTSGTYFLVKNDSSTSNGWAVGTSGGRLVTRLNKDFVTNSFNLATTQAFNDGQWHHIHVQWDSAAASETDAASIFVDGRKQVLTKIAGYYEANQDYNNSGSLRVGRSNHPQFPNSYTGALDELRIYNRALSDGEICELAADQCGLVAHYPLDGNGDDVIAGQNAAPHGNVVYSSERRAGNQVVKLDGNSYLRVENFSLSVDDVSVSMWVYADDLPEWYRVPFAIHTGETGYTGLGDRNIMIDNARCYQTDACLVGWVSRYNGFYYTSESQYPRFRGFEPGI